MNPPVVVLDTGAVGRISTDRELRTLLQDLVSDGWNPLIPSVVLAEATTGQPTDGPVNHVVKRLGTVVTTESTARTAGRLRAVVDRAGRRRLPSGIDAIVAGHAAEVERAVVFTTDPADLAALLADHARVVVERA